MLTEPLRTRNVQGKIFMKVSCLTILHWTILFGLKNCIAQKIIMKKSSIKGAGWVGGWLAEFMLLVMHTSVNKERYRSKVNINKKNENKPKPNYTQSF
jgi:hypothetical protein